MKKLIVTADDYGMSLAVNRAIDAGIAAGLITSTNVMTNMPFYEEAVRLKETGASVGIHFTLSCGSPVSDAKTIPTLVSDNGDFYKYPEFRKRFRKGLIAKEDIITELEAQYERYVALLGEPDYWNTHQNVHVDFRIYRIFVDFAVKHKICKMRSHQRLYVQGSTAQKKRSLAWRVMEPLKARMLDIWQSNAHRRGVGSPDGLVCCLNPNDINNPQYLFRNIGWKNKSVAEYVIHPATHDDSPYFGSIVEQRVREYEMFTSDETKRIIEGADIELSTY